MLEAHLLTRVARDGRLTAPAYVALLLHCGHEAVAPHGFDQRPQEHTQPVSLNDGSQPVCQILARWEHPGRARH